MQNSNTPGKIREEFFYNLVRRAARPVIAKTPKKISYRGNFDVAVAGNPREIASVVLLRSDHNTHSLTTT